jgi:hypothetical protein
MAIRVSFCALKMSNRPAKLASPAFGSTAILTTLGLSAPG